MFLNLYSERSNYHVHALDFKATNVPNVAYTLQCDRRIIWFIINISEA